MRANETTERARAEALFKKKNRCGKVRRRWPNTRRRNKRSEKRLPGFARCAWRVPNRAGIETKCPAPTAVAPCWKCPAYVAGGNAAL